MIIHSYFIAYNEEVLLPWVLDYHSKFFDKIFVYDNMSTDNSDKIYQKYPKVTVTKFQSNNYMDIYALKNIKNTEYKQSRGIADWVVVSDCDELVYHEHLLDKLYEYMKQGITMPLTDGRGLISHSTPIYDGTKLLTDVVKLGTKERIPLYSKNIIFNPILDVNYDEGGHKCTCPEAVYSDNRELKMLHLSWLSKDFMLERYKCMTNRLSPQMRQKGLGTHCINPAPFIRDLERWLNDNYQLIP